MGNIKLSKRAKVKLEMAELDRLKTYLEKQSGAYATIKLNTGLTYQTVSALAKNGFAQVGTIKKIRIFLKKLS